MITMDKRMCANCACRDHDGYCPYVDRLTFDFEHCPDYYREHDLNAMEYCMIAMAVLAFLCMLVFVPGCERQQPAKTVVEEQVVFVVSDKPCPEYLLKQDEKQDDPVNDEDRVPEVDDDLSWHHESNVQPAAYRQDCAADGVLTMQSGVNQYNGKTETYYSSNVLRHYRIGEWECGDDGVWRDSDGYVIIASSEMPQGTVHETSLGVAKVYDSGCAPGVVDVYVAW